MENSSLLIGGKQFSSRLMIGTGKYKSTQDMVESLSNSETEIITVAVRRIKNEQTGDCLLYTSPSPRDKRQSRMPSSA